MSLNGPFDNVAAPGTHISARAGLDARVSFLEVVYVKLAIHFGRGLTVRQAGGQSWFMMPHNIISPREARQELVSAKLAPKDHTTLNELRGRRPQEQLREIPADVMSFELKLQCNWIAKFLQHV